MSPTSKGTQAFNVPNDSEGKEFLRLLRKFSHNGTAYRARSRGPRKRPGDLYVTGSRRASIPQEDAEWFAVYMGFNENSRFTSVTRVRSPESHQLWKLRNGQYPTNPLGWREKQVLKIILDDTVDGLTPDLDEEKLTALEEINGKLDL